MNSKSRPFQEVVPVEGVPGARLALRWKVVSVRGLIGEGESLSFARVDCGTGDELGPGTQRVE